ncbi:MAG: enoyl-CoA hydratase/isomerase family protein [Deltaproteobacteria bacterium]|nr:enoyl-CoA hydratase/isomerase family protein [Deltaproteobacteria bacterium]
MSKVYALNRIDIQGDICWVSINRPGDRNSINTALMEEMEQLLAETEKTAVRAIVFTGAGDSYFIGGADGVEMMQYDAEGALAFSAHIQRLFNRMEESPLILVAAINGLCYGGGYEFALACDYRIASETARLGLPEVRVGIIPGGGGTQRLPRLVGKGRALEIILRGRLYDAQEARELGLVNQVAPAAELPAEAAKFLKSIFKNPQYALAHAKKAVQAAQNLDCADGLQVEREQFKECFKEDFFVNEICSQIKAGRMKTTEVLPDWVSEKIR